MGPTYKGRRRFRSLGSIPHPYSSITIPETGRKLRQTTSKLTMSNRPEGIKDKTGWEVPTEDTTDNVSDNIVLVCTPITIKYAD